MFLGGLFDQKNKEKKLSELEKIINASDFWDDIKKANGINLEYQSIKKSLSELNEFAKNIDNINEIYELLKIDFDNKIYNELLNLINKNETLKKELEIQNLLNGKYDKLNCYLEIHPGAGGTEAQDWASMLQRMYEKFLNNNNYKYEIVDLQDGEEAGIKSVTIHILGEYAYGYLKCEQGVHRLVRISPFDSNKRRHTSFASVSVTPEFDDDINIDINEKDLKIDVFHSSGAGGQSVNTANSAVRITHLPTKIVVSVQNERSQLKNKEIAMKLLYNKLYKIKLDKLQEQENSLKSNVSINFGSQIRNYVLEPYTLVKDSRSGYETANAYKVLDGDIKEIIESVLKKG